MSATTVARPGAWGARAAALGRRPALALLIGFNLLSAGVGAWLVWQARATELEHARLRAATLASLLSRNVEAALDQGGLLLESVASQVERHLAAQGRADVDLWRTVDGQTALAPQVSHIGVFDARGRQVCEPGSPRCGRLDISDRPYFQALQREPSATPRLTGPFTGRRDAVESMALARALFGPQGEFAGVGVALIPLSELDLRLRGLDLGRHGVALLRGLDYRLLAVQPPLPASVPQSVRHQAPSELPLGVAQSPQAGVYQAVTPLDGVPRLTAYRRVGNYPVLALVGLAEEDRLAGWRTLSATVAVLWGLLSAASVAIYRLQRATAARNSQVLGLLAQVSGNEDRVRRTYEKTPALLHAVDAEGRLVMVSDAWLARLGYRREQVLGRPSVDFLTPASRERALAVEMPRLRITGRQDDLPFQMLTRSGETVDVLLSARVERDGADHVVRVVAGLQDVTLRRAAEAALAAERQRLLNIIEGTHAGIWEWNVQTGELRLNERSAAMLGETLASLGPISIALRTQRTHAHDMAVANDLIRRHFAGELDYFETESRLRHRDGHWVWLLDRGRLLTRTPDGKPEWMFGIHQDITARKDQELALRKSQVLLDRMGEMAGVGGWSLDLATQKIDWSRQTRRIHGVPDDYEPELATAINFYAPEARPVVQAAVERGMASGEPWDLELPFIRQGGERIWVRAQGAVEFEHGVVVRLAGAFQDITRRKAMEQRLIERERFMRHVLDSVPALIAHIGLDQRYTLVNRAYLAADHRSAQELVGRSVRQVHGEAGYAQLAPHLAQALAGQGACFDVELQRGDEQRAMQVTYVPDLDDDGRVQGVFSMKVDFTAQRRAEQKLRQVMEASPLGMFVADAQGNCVFTNAAWQRIAGMGEQQSLLRGWGQALHPDDRPRLRQAWRDCVASGAVASAEFRYVHADGLTVWVRGYLAPILPGSYAAGAVGTVEDISERRRIDQALAQTAAELQRSNADLERFAYVASHDLQEPLRMVTSYGDLLLRRHRSGLPTEAQEFLDFMVDGGRRAQALIRDLLSLARIDSQAQPFEPVDLQALLAEVLRLLPLHELQPAAEVCHGPLPTVQGDARQIGQLLTNLLSNAIKFRGPEPLRVQIDAERIEPGTSSASADAQGAWRISVRDNGIGIEPRYFERIFVMFQRLHLRSEHEGTGIGLAICRRVVERHGGRIGVISSPGRGSTFHFTLPDRPRDLHRPPP